MCCVSEVIIHPQMEPWAPLKHNGQSLSISNKHLARTHSGSSKTRDFCFYKVRVVVQRIHSIG